MNDCLMVRESFVNRTKNVRFGDSDWYQTYTNDRGALFLDMQREYGRCTRKMYREYRDKPDAPVGWVFEKQMLYEDARPTHTSVAGNPQYDEDDYYLREVWVEVAEPAVANTVAARRAA